MKKLKRTKDDPLILVHDLKTGQRRVCHWIENDKPRKEYYARRLWKQIYGEIPKGYDILYKDHNTLNDVIENYEIVKHGTRDDVSRFCVFLNKHDKMDNDKKTKYILRWNQIEGATAMEKLNSVLQIYNIPNLYQLYEKTGIDFGQLSRIKNKNTGLGLKNIKRLFDSLDKINV